jgi:peptidoglycan-associated lipoprotein
MKGTFSWKWAVLALSVAALMAVGCAKKQTVKSEGAPGAAAPGAVSEAPVKEAPAAPVGPTLAEQRASAAAAGVAVTEEKPSQFDDVRFDFDKSEVREDGRRTCQVVADYLKKNPRAKLEIEGHCDERGTAEYNLALGERRATAVMTYLVSLGVSKAGLSTVSFGKEKPLDPGHDEEAWAKNRRAHFVLK